MIQNCSILLSIAHSFALCLLFIESFFYYSYVLNIMCQSQAAAAAERVSFLDTLSLYIIYIYIHKYSSILEAVNKFRISHLLLSITPCGASSSTILSSQYPKQYTIYVNRHRKILNLLNIHVLALFFSNHHTWINIFCISIIKYSIYINILTYIIVCNIYKNLTRLFRFFFSFFSFYICSCYTHSYIYKQIICFSVTTKIIEYFQKTKKKKLYICSSKTNQNS